MVAELAHTKIGVNALMPGLTDTALARAAFDAQGRGEGMFDKYAQSLPLGANTTEEAAALSLYLLSDEARRVTGQIVAMR
jgi:NAD(P)-dependent dehydrogenase (short-subunit alcohol dehydrogenase family)